MVPRAKGILGPLILTALALPKVALAQNTPVLTVRGSYVAYSRLEAEGEDEAQSYTGGGVRPEALLWYTGQNFNVAATVYLEGESLRPRSPAGASSLDHRFESGGAGLGLHLTFKAIPYAFVAGNAGASLARYRHTHMGEAVTDEYPLGLAYAGSFGFGSSALESGAFLQAELQVVRYSRSQTILPNDVDNLGLVKKTIALALGLRVLL